MAIPPTPPTDCHPFFYDVVPTIEKLGQTLSDSIAASINTLIQNSADGIRKIRLQIQQAILNDTKANVSTIAIELEKSLNVIAVHGAACVDKANAKLDPENLVDSFGNCLKDVLKGMNQSTAKALKALQQLKTSN